MLVGVGLTQIGTIDDQLRTFSDFLGDKTAHLGPSAETLPAIGPFVLIFGLVSGFIFFYLYTRLYLSALFQHVEKTLGDVLMDDRDIGEGADEVIKAAEKLRPESENPSIQMVSGGATPSVNQTLDIIRSLLYADAGYQEAIDLGNKVSRSSASSNPEYWLLMACAFGQKHHALISAAPDQKSQKEVTETRNSVITCVRNAVRLDPRYRKRLLAMANPNAYDNDLRDFQQDGEFLSLVA